MINPKPPPMIFTNAITNEVFDAAIEARTKNRDILLVAYHGNIHESCSEFFSCISSLRDSFLSPPTTPSGETRDFENLDDSSGATFHGSERLPSSCKNDILFRHRARDIVQSTTFIFIGRSNRKELVQFQKDMLNLDPRNHGEKNILTEALSFLFQHHDCTKGPKNCGKEEDHLWFRLVKDSNSLICNRLGATLPPSWWGEDPSIIPTMFLVSANGKLNKIYVGKTDNRRNDGFHFGIGRRAHSGIFPCRHILELLIEERIRRAKMVYKWCKLAKKEFFMIENTNKFEEINEEHSIFSNAVPTDVLSHIYEFLDHREDICRMELVSKAALRITQEITIRRLRNLLNQIETIFPDTIDEDLSELEEDDRVSSFSKKIRALSIPQKSSLYSLNDRTTSIDSTRTASSFSSACYSDISECIDDLDRSSLSYSSKFDGAELWMGWRCHMLTSVCTANALLNRFQFLIEKRFTDSLNEANERIHFLKSCRQNVFGML